MPKELEELLADFEREDTRRSLRTIIAHVPSLKADLETAAREDNLVQIRYADLNGSNGLYDYRTKTLTLGRGLKEGVDRGDTDSIIALAYSAGHEASHASRGDVSLAHTAQIEREVAQTQAQGPGVRDYTAVAQRHADYILNEEAKAEIGGFNAAVSATKWKEREEDISDVLQSLARKGPGGLVEGPAALALAQFSQYVESAQNKFGGTDYRLKDGVEPNEGGHLDPAKASDIGFMRKHFSDREFFGEPSKDRHYRHTAIADVVATAIAKTGAQPSEIGLDFEALEAHRAGLATKLRSPQSQAISMQLVKVASESPDRLDSPPSLVWPQPPLRPDASGPQEFAAESRKRLREPSPESVENEGQGVKALKSALNPELLEQARTCLATKENREAIAELGMARSTERVALGIAVAAYNNHLPKIEEVTINRGDIWVSSAPKGMDYGRNAYVGSVESCGRKTEEEHLANLREPSAHQGPAQGGVQPAQDFASRKNQQI